MTRNLPNLLRELKVTDGNGIIEELVQVPESTFSNDDIAELAMILAHSGRTTDYKSQYLATADIPSTGGPSSLSTLLTPLFLKQYGFIVPKLGIPGRPAGGIDVLAQLAGYNIKPAVAMLNEWLTISSYIHFIGGDTHVPLDRKFFELRKSVGKINVPVFVIASLLSKKVAVGIEYVGLDVRVSEFGNFGRSWEKARVNSERFVEVASLLGIKAKCFLTNSNYPYQPFIGRGESLVALQMLFKRKKGYKKLMKHALECFTMATSVASVLDKRRQSLDLQTTRKLFMENIKLQGSSEEAFEEVVTQVQDQHINHIVASKAGYVKIDMQGIRKAITSVQSAFEAKGMEYPDPCGVILKQMPGEFVNKGSILCSYRCSGKFKEAFFSMLSNSITVSEELKLMYSFEEIQ